MRGRLRRALHRVMTSSGTAARPEGRRARRSTSRGASSPSTGAYHPPRAPTPTPRRAARARRQDVGARAPADEALPAGARDLPRAGSRAEQGLPPPRDARGVGPGARLRLRAPAFPTDPDVKGRLSEFTWEEDLSPGPARQDPHRHPDPRRGSRASSPSWASPPPPSGAAPTTRRRPRRPEGRRRRRGRRPHQGAYATRNPTIVVFLYLHLLQAPRLLSAGSPYDVCRLYPHAMVISATPPADAREVRDGAPGPHPQRQNAHQRRARDGITHDYHRCSQATPTTPGIFGFEEWVGGNQPVPLWPNMFDRVAPRQRVQSSPPCARPTTPRGVEEVAHAPAAVLQALPRDDRLGPSRARAGASTTTSGPADRLPPGRYDNLHTAPRDGRALRDPRRDAPTTPGASRSRRSRWRPSACDCFHTHWRWSAPTGTTAGIYFPRHSAPRTRAGARRGQHRANAPDGSPQPAGRRRVRGQEVHLRPPRSTSRPRKWQVFFHHGSATRSRSTKVLSAPSTRSAAPTSRCFNGLLAVPLTPRSSRQRDGLVAGNRPARHAARLKDRDRLLGDALLAPVLDDLARGLRAPPASTRVSGASDAKGNPWAQPSHHRSVIPGAPWGSAQLTA